MEAPARNGAPGASVRKILSNYGVSLKFHGSYVFGDFPALWMVFPGGGADYEGGSVACELSVVEIDIRRNVGYAFYLRNGDFL